MRGQGLALRETQTRGHRPPRQLHSRAICAGSQKGGVRAGGGGGEEERGSRSSWQE